MPISTIDNKSGLSSVVVSIEQGGDKKQLFNRTFQRKAWFSKAGPGELKETVEIDVTKVGVKDGKATLIVTTRDFSLNGVFKGNETSLQLPVTIDTKPPRVSVEHCPAIYSPWWFRDCCLFAL